MHGASGVDLRVNSLKALELLVKESTSPSEVPRKLQHLLEAVQSWKLLTEHAIETEEGEREKAANFEEVRTSGNYVAHYVSCHRDFVSKVIVVLWKSPLPGPAVYHDGLPAIYVHQQGVPDADFSEWGPSTPPPTLREFSPTQTEAAKQARQAIALHQSRLFTQHSNLVAVRCCADQEDGTVVIEFVVLCKRFLPLTDKHRLPRLLEGFPTRVRSGWVEFCGRKEQMLHRPLLPGAGFAAGAQAALTLDVPPDEYAPPVLGTMGGCYVAADGQRFGVTCAHCISDQRGEQTVLPPRDTPVYQPSALCLLMAGSASAMIPEVWSGYDRLRETRNAQDAMRWLCEQVPNAPEVAVLPAEAQCGVVHGAVLGPIDTGDVVDVALIRLDEEVAMVAKCAPLLVQHDGQ